MQGGGPIVADHEEFGRTLNDPVGREAESEQARYRDLLDFARDAYVVTDAAGTVIRANRAFEALAGARNAVPGTSLEAVVAQTHRPAFRSLLVELGNGGRVRDADLLLRDENGSSTPVSASAAAAERTGSPPEIQWLFSDLTTRRQADTQLRAIASVLEEKVAGRTAELEDANKKLDSERGRLERLLEQLRDGVITIDRALTVDFANEAARKLLPARLERGVPLPDAWPDVPLRELAERLFAPGAETVEKRFVRAESVFSIVGIPAGASDTAVLVIAEVSERERRERSEREFVTNAAHELQTPLTAIGSSIEILQSGAKEDPVERDRFLAHIEEGNQRLVRLTRALLVLARAQLGTERPRADVVDLGPLLREVAGTLAHREDVEIRVTATDGLTIMSNRDLVEQAVLNLAGNAAKFTLSGHITLTARKADDGWFAIGVEDTGPGIPSDRLAQVFERFYRGEEGGASGFGIGLAIVWQTVRALGGRIEIDSAAEGGTTARILLPAAPTDIA